MMSKGKNDKKTSSAPNDSYTGGWFRNEEIISKTYELIGPLCDAEGYELIHVEYQREAAGRILRLYIDKPDGITLDDCVRISRQAGDILDVGLEMDESYNLEVSSPGLDRPLVKRQDFDRFRGQPVSIRTDQPVNGQKNFKGILLGISADEVDVRIDTRNVKIPFERILKARLSGGN